MTVMVCGVAPTSETNEFGKLNDTVRASAISPTTLAEADAFDMGVEVATPAPVE
jgi:hypothetical protein